MPSNEKKDNEPHVDCLGRPLPAWDDREGWEKLRTRHLDELARRSRWCLDNGHLPVHENQWRAPGDDSEFMFGVRPWQSDSSEVNPDGVAWMALDWFEPQQKNTGPSGWACRHCGEWIDRAPRDFVGKDEPHDWWWCFQCRKTVKKPTKKELMRKREIDSNTKLDAFLGRKKSRG